MVVARCLGILGDTRKMDSVLPGTLSFLMKSGGDYQLFYFLLCLTDGGEIV